MAPRSFPDEIDVFTVPHSRMKELVNIYTQKVQCLDFRDGREVISLLHDLGTTLYEFKSHESIENIFIMDQLKNRLKQRQIHNSAVCDCHNDNRLADVLQLVRTGTKVREQGIGERLSFCQELQRAFEEFVENFLTHMEEEEQVFQPLLVEYFEYDELKVLKDIVLKEHEHVKERHNLEKAQEEEPETCDIVKDLRDLDWDLCCLSDESLRREDDYCSQISHALPVEESVPKEVSEGCYYDDISADSFMFSNAEAPRLPAEILFEIFRQLSPQDLGRCAQVCSSWNAVVYSPALWKAVYPVQWARGIWEWYDIGLCNALEDAANRKVSSDFHKWDEDKDIDEVEDEGNPVAAREHAMLEELVNCVLPRVGRGVSTLVVDAGLGITSRLLHDALVLCPYITKLSAAHTQIDYYLFKGLWRQGVLRRLQHLDLQGCELIDDDALECLAQCAAPDNPYLSTDNGNPSREEVLALSTLNGGGNSWNEPVAISSAEPVFQYCGYCTCWRANVVAQRPPNNSYMNSFCQSRHNQFTHRKSAFSNSTDYRRQNLLHNTSNSRQECEREQSIAHLHSSSSLEVLNPERDIEEICCRPGSAFSSEDNAYQSGSCQNFAQDDDCEYFAYTRGQGNELDTRGQGNELDPVLGSSGHFQLLYLNLSGCWRVTDEGLLALVDARAVDRLCHLDVSGCFQLSGEGLKLFTCDSRALKGENLFYCDNIVDGPYPTQANGCANLCNPVRMCCRNGR